MGEFHRLSAKQAADLVKRSPESVVFTLATFMLNFGLTEEELIAELRAGRLVAAGDPTAGGYENICISVTAFLDWATNENTPEALVTKALNFSKRRAGRRLI